MSRRWIVLPILTALVVIAVAARGAAAPGSQTLASPPGTEAPASGSPVSGLASTVALDAPTTMPPPISIEATLPSPGADEPLATLLGLLRIAPESRFGYSRSLFIHWVDADGDGCDTRRE